MLENRSPAYSPDGRLTVFVNYSRRRLEITAVERRWYRSKYQESLAELSQTRC